MKLESFSIKNYRSITKAYKISLHNSTILVGKNNEGKSNILKAMALSFEILEKYYLYKGKVPDLSHFSVNNNYKWNRDFPINSQEKESRSKSTNFELEFNLTKEELLELNKLLNCKLSTNNLSIIIKIDNNNIPKIQVPKQGTIELNEQILSICEFIVKKIVFNYIPAIRTEEQALELIRQTISQELKYIENNEEYIEALEMINKLQKEPLNNIAKKVKKTLEIFLPSVKDVKIEIEQEVRRMFLRRNIEVLIDDGVLTNIEYKGDGIKSLATLAMLKDRYNTELASIIAIDEPEAHLHSEAINQLNKIILNLVESNQVIISTHNPLFINRKNIDSNIIVSSGKATPAKNIKEIRDILGVKISDNLMSSKYVLFVEGENDKKIIESFLRKNSKKIKEALDNLLLSINILGGASNLSIKLIESRNNIFEYHVLLDNDRAGKSAFEKAKKEELIDLKQVDFVNCPGMTESEIEDCIDTNIYEKQIMDKYGVNINNKKFKSMKKWSEKMNETFLAEGKVWNEDIEKEVKELVASIASEEVKKQNIFYSYREECMTKLIENIEELIKDK